MIVPKKDYGTGLTKRFFLLICLTGFFFNLFAISPAIVQSSQTDAVITLISPDPDYESILKHLQIKARFNRPVPADSLIIILDDSDITALMKIDEEGIEGVLPTLMNSGRHTLYVSGNCNDNPFAETFTFSTRQYTHLDEAYSSNEWNTTVQTGRFHSNQSKDFNFSSLDSTLNHQSTVKQGNWQAHLFANARLLQQSSSDETEAMNHGSIDPEHQGLDLNTILFQLQYQDERLQSLLEVGDLQVEETQNTFSALARNGVQMKLDFLNFYLRGFSVYSKETFGLHDGIGLGFDDDEYLYGINGGYRFWQDRFDLRIFYIDGGQRENSYSSWSAEEGNSGDLYGIQLTGIFFDGRLTSELEYDRSDYDPYTSDDFDSEKDKAWRLQVGGNGDIFSGNFCYEYFGPDYNLPGDLTGKCNYEGFTGTAAAVYDVHNLEIMLAIYHDNVDGNELYARTYSYSGQISYAYSGINQFPLSLSYRHTQDKSSNEPEYTPKTYLKTDILTFNLDYSGTGVFNVNLGTSYTWQNDASSQDNDTTTFSLALSPSWTFEHFQLCLNGTLNQNRNLLADIRTDDYIFTLDASGSLFNEKLNYEFGGTYNYTSVKNDLGDCQSFNGYSRINYHLPWLVEVAHPILGVEFQYNRNDPEESEVSRENRVMCTLSTAVPFTF